MGLRPIMRSMNLTEAQTTPTRTLTIVLPEAEWQALRTAEPDAVGWLHAKIRQRLGEPAPPPKRTTSWAEDEY
jgi:hypothetical protein